MILDKENRFSDGQNVTAAAASENIIDLKKALQNIGVGENLYIVVSLNADMVDVGSDSTLAVALEQDDNEAFSSATAVQTIGTFAATSAAGSRLVARIQPDAVTERYIRLQYTPANGDLTSSGVDAFITKDIQAFTAYESGFSVQG